jgi:AAA15 family ATPase/GTPase
MLKTVHIKNFRGFESFELRNLGQINLLVGRNNSGKTSVLEAIQLLCSGTDLDTLKDIMVNRGELFRSDEPRSEPTLNICHLFYGHQMQDSIEIIGKTEKSQNEFTAIFQPNSTNREISINQGNENFNLQQLSLEFFQGNELFIKSVIHGEPTQIKISLSAEDGLPVSQIRRSTRVAQQTKTQLIKTQFVKSSSLNVDGMIDLFDNIVLTSEEKTTHEALQIIEPNIKRVASISNRKYRYSSELRGGFVVQLADSEQRIPIGSLGDGIWRMLGLALSLACAKGGVLLVDEIDTGLHFTTLADMWKLIWETATKLDVQVFATTHSSDCWLSLATVASQDDAVKEGVSIQRIEPHKKQAVAFTEEEIIIAAERGIEVR